MNAFALEAEKTIAGLFCGSGKFHFKESVMIESPFWNDERGEVKEMEGVGQRKKERRKERDGRRHYIANGGFTGLGIEFELDDVDERHFGCRVLRRRNEEEVVIDGDRWWSVLRVVSGFGSYVVNVELKRMEVKTRMERTLLLKLSLLDQSIIDRSYHECSMNCLCMSCDMSLP